MHKRKLVVGLGLLATTGILLSACAGTAADEPATQSDSGIATQSLQTLIEAAEAEGALTLLGEIQEPDLIRLAEGFEETYGIKVDIVRLGGNSFSQRFDTEAQTGSPTVDVLIGGDLEFFSDMIQKGNLVSFDDSGVHDLLDGFPSEYAFDDYGVPLLSTLATGFVYNTDKVDPSEIPTDWNALAGEKWAGRFCSVDPATLLSLVQFFSVVRETESEDVLTAMGQNISRWYPDIVAMNESVAVGECDLALNSALFFAEAMKAAGAPVEFATAPTTIFPTPTTAVVAKAAHPNAARLFMHFILSKEGNALLNNPTEGDFGPWDGDQMPADFWVATPQQFQQWRSETPEILELLGL